MVSLVKWLSSESSSNFVTYKMLRKLNCKTKLLCNINYFNQKVVIDYSFKASTQISPSALKGGAGLYHRKILQ